MPDSTTPYNLMPTDLPPLSDSAAVEILDFLHELVYRFEAHYSGQIHRFHEQRRDIGTNLPSESGFDEDVPF